MSEPFASLLPGTVIVQAADPDGVDDGEALFDEERAFVERAVDRRRREFAAGRACARRAMAALGIAPAALVNGEDRAPVWPAGVVGSIAHTRGYCAVAVARSTDLAALGIDVEPAVAVKPELFERICTADELSVIAGGGSLRGRRALRRSLRSERRFRAHRDVLVTHASSVRKCTRPRPFVTSADGDDGDRR